MAFGLFLFAASQAAFAVSGLSVSKTCDTPVAVGATINCSFQVNNDEPSGGFPTRSFVVTNTVPFPGGTTTALDCRIGGVGPPIDILGPEQSCIGTFTETAPSCSAGTFDDRLEAHGTQNSVFVQDVTDFGVTLTGTTCTPTPTPTNTPTPSSTSTRTPTPTPTTPPSGLNVTKNAPLLSRRGANYVCSFTVTNTGTGNVSDIVIGDFEPQSGDTPESPSPASGAGST